MLLLSTLGCSKKDEPAPTLEGTWDITAIVTTQYYADGTTRYQNTATFPVGKDINARYVTYTSTTMQAFFGLNGASTPAIGYTRSGNTLSFSIIPAGSSTPAPVGESAITLLTATELTLLAKGPATQPAGSPYDYSTNETHYMRR